MAILKVENLFEYYEDFNSPEATEGIFSEARATEYMDSEGLYQERKNMDLFFQRYTVSVDNSESFSKYKEKFKEEYYYLDRISDEAYEKYLSSEGDEKEANHKEYKRANKVRNEALEIYHDLHIKEWTANKLESGMKLSKKLSKMGVRQEFLDWASTQEKSERVVQVTINPTTQAVAGMANYAKKRSWTGYQGTSCQDTRHDDNYCHRLAGAIADDKLYSIQLSYPEDNLGLINHMAENNISDMTEGIASYEVTSETVTDDILYFDGMQDNLKARTLGRVWNLREQTTDSSCYTSELEQLIKQLSESEVDFYFMKTVQSYGDNITKKELENAIDQISEILPLLNHNLKGDY